MKSSSDNIKDDLYALWGLLVTLRQLPSGKAKGLHLVAALQEWPRLVRYFRIVYGKSELKDEVKKDLKKAAGDQEELRRVCLGIFRKDFQCDMAPSVVAKAFSIIGKELAKPAETPQPQPRLSLVLELTSKPGSEEVCWGKLLHRDAPLCDITTTRRMSHQCLFVLQALGIKVVVHDSHKGNHYEWVS